MGASRYLLPGQAFFVRVSAASTPANVSFPRTATYPGYYDAATPPTPAPETRPLLELTLAGTTGPTDKITAYFQAGATTGFDRLLDAHKPPTTDVPRLAFAEATLLAINARPALTAADVALPLEVRVPVTGTYTLRASRLLNLPAGTFAYLVNAQTNTRHDLSTAAPYQFTLNAGVKSNRFSLLLTRTQMLGTAPAALTQQVQLYPNPANAQVRLELPASLSRQLQAALLVNNLGQVVRRYGLRAGSGASGVNGIVAGGCYYPVGTESAPYLSLAGVAPGVYSLQLNTDEGTVSKRLVVE